MDGLIHEVMLLSMLQFFDDVLSGSPSYLASYLVELGRAILLWIAVFFIVFV
jgi:hypothetical protein